MGRMDPRFSGLCADELPTKLPVQMRLTFRPIRCHCVGLRASAIEAHETAVERARTTRFGHSLYSKADSGGRTCWQKSPDAGQTVMRQYFPPLRYYWCICFSKRDCAVRSRL